MGFCALGLGFMKIKTIEKWEWDFNLSNTGWDCGIWAGISKKTISWEMELGPPLHDPRTISPYLLLSWTNFLASSLLIPPIFSEGSLFITRQTYFFSLVLRTINCCNLLRNNVPNIDLTIWLCHFSSLLWPSAPLTSSCSRCNTKPSTIQERVVKG